ncbi:hypothetical protein [Streptomyces sp. NPDC016172]|uniref:hypothetical protein n=1 Tax=Streptomyces sp. NPDC016172 TaxID=3364964 RepID=UPI0036F8AB8C
MPGGSGVRDAAARAAGETPHRVSSPPDPTTDVDGPAPGLPRIRPALAPELRVTFHDGMGRSRSRFAVQRLVARVYGRERFPTRATS